MNKKNRLIPYLFVAPAVLLVFIFYIFPFVIALIISFTNMDLKGLADFSKIKFIGSSNYYRLFKDDIFVKSIMNTMFFVFFGVPVVVIYSLFLALLVNFRESKFFTAMRSVFYMPSVTNIVAVSVVFLYMYNPVFGLLNFLLGKVGISPVYWLTGGPIISKISLIIMAVWRASGLNMIIFLAALKGVPKEYYEAAKIDGAGPPQQLLKITLPQIFYAVMFVSITTVIGWIQFFDEPFIMTDGNPLNGTLSIALFIYKNGFKFNKFGYSATASLVLLAGIMLVTMIQFQISKKFDKMGV